LSPEHIQDKSVNISALANSSISPMMKYDKKVLGDIKVGAIRRIKDYTLLSQACKRAGKTRV
jgi:hypothetical protein